MNIKYYLENKEKLNKKYKFFIEKKQLIKIKENKNLILAHIKKAEHNLKLISKLDSEFNDWKIISLYYCLYHSSLALLINKGYISKNHNATLIFLIINYTQINNDEIKLINELQLKEEDAKFYSTLKNERENANYSSNIIFDNDTIIHLKKRTIEFLNKVKIILKLNEL